MGSKTLTVTIDASYYRGALTWAGVPVAVTNGKEAGYVDFTDQAGADISAERLAQLLMEGLLNVWTEYGSPQEPIPSPRDETPERMAIRRMIEGLERFTRAADIVDDVVPDHRTDRPLAQLREHVREVRREVGAG